MSVQLLEGTEPEIESRKERLDLGSRTSRSDGMADIFTTAGSEVDGQPYSKVGLPALEGDLDLQQTRSRGINGVEYGGESIWPKSSEESREREEGSNGGSL